MKRIPSILIALDGLAGNRDKTLEIADRLHDVGENFGWKVNIDYLLNDSEGLRALLKPVMSYDRPVMADIKLWNGARTMGSVAKTLVALGVDIFNVWMLADDQLSKVIEVTKDTNTEVLGLTVLSHYDDAYCQKYFKRSLGEMVCFLATVAADLDCDGVIFPGTKLPDMATVKTSKDLIWANPGIRTDWFKDKRHKQDITPLFAARNGSDIIIPGSPIMKNNDPVKALQAIYAEMRGESFEIPN